MSGQAASYQQRQASDPAASAWVSANAGSGKTRVLVDRVMRLLLQKVDPARILCLTFTKAAAAEMSNRLFDRLSGWIALADSELIRSLAALGIEDATTELLTDARQLFTRALETPGGLKIQTIHAFCERVLQLFPVEAGTMPHFSMLDEVAARQMLQQARDLVMREALSSPEQALGRALSEIANRLTPEGFEELLERVIEERAALRAVLDEGPPFAAVDAALRVRLGLSPGETQADVENQLRLDRDRYSEFAEALARGSKADRTRSLVLRSVLRDPVPTLLALRDFYLTDQDEPRSRLGTKPVRDRLPWLEEFIATEQTRLSNGLGRSADLERIRLTLALLAMGARIVAGYESAKRQHNMLDFDDLIIRTRALLAERPDASWVLYKLDGGIEHLLLDEAQDTSPAQWGIILSLLEEFFAGAGRHYPKPRTVFVVGDRKQSIFSFQGADPDVFEEVHGEIGQRVRAADLRFEDVSLTVSYRSTSEILRAVDTVFAPGERARQGLDGRSFRDWLHEAGRRETPGKVEVWPLVLPLDREEPAPWLAPVDCEPAQSPRRRLARHIAETVAGWIGRRPLPGQDRTVEPGDVLILVARRDQLFDALIRALWTARVPVAGADRLRLTSNIAVLDLIALAQFCTMPEDDHALACVLKSPVMAVPLDEDGLIAVAAERGGRSLWQSLCQSQQPAARMAAAQLGQLVAAAPSARPFEFLAGVLAAARRRFLNRLGSEANDALDAMLDRALAYEENQGTSLAGFVNDFQASAIVIKRDMEQNSGEVRIMTVHGAKGLEAPIVILPDTTSDPEKRRRNPLLMLPGAGPDQHVPLWAAPGLFRSQAFQGLLGDELAAAIAEHQRQLYVAMTRARDELYVCGHAGERALSSLCWYETVRAGLDAVPLRALNPAAPPAIAADPAPVPVPLPEWIERPVPAAAPSGGGTGRPPARSGQRVARGILIHRILQQLPEIEEKDRTAHIQAAVARSGHDPALALELDHLLQHPDFAEVFRADGLSEVALITEVPGRGPERRRIDRLVMNDRGILVVDYKSDRDWPNSADGVSPEYLVQLAAYRAALRRIHPGLPLRLALLWTEAPRLMEIADDILDHAAGQPS